MMYRRTHCGFTTYLKPETVKAVDKIAAEDYTSRTRVIEHAVDEFLERRRKRDNLESRGD